MSLETPLRIGDTLWKRGDPIPTRVPSAASSPAPTSPATGTEIRPPSDGAATTAVPEPPPASKGVSVQKRSGSLCHDRAAAFHTSYYGGA